MKMSWYHVLITVLLTSTVAWSVYTYTLSRPVNSSVEVVLETSTTFGVTDEVIVEDTIAMFWNLEDEKISVWPVDIVNRDLPSYWKGKSLFLEYTYLGDYEKGLEEDINDLLNGKYRWKTQLDKNGDVLFNGPLIRKNGTYQLYVHNTLFLAQKYYLLGDLLHYFSSNKELIGTHIKIGELTFEVMWEEEIDVLKNPKLKESADLIISTCLERDGSQRLVVGFDIVK